MENGGELEKMRKVYEFMIQGKDIAQQLQIQLNSPSSSSQETREHLISMIVESYEKSLQIMNSGRTEQELPLCHGTGGSPRSEDSDHEHPVQSLKKTMPRWKKNVRVVDGAEIEGTLDDGFSWRKYGQKDILGAKFPRGYYRCTHRNSQGCLATKQVQRSDIDHSIFDVTYRGMHTCRQSANTVSSNPINSMVQNQEPTNTQQPENFHRNFHIESQGLNTIYHDQQSQLQLQSQVEPPPEELFVDLPSASSVRQEGNNIDHPFYMLQDCGLFGSNNNYDFWTFERRNTSIHDYSASEVAPSIVSIPVSSSSNSSSVGLDFPIRNTEIDPNCLIGNLKGFFPQ